MTKSHNKTQILSNRYKILPIWAPTLMAITPINKITANNFIFIVTIGTPLNQMLRNFSNNSIVIAAHLAFYTVLNHLNNWMKKPQIVIDAYFSYFDMNCEIQVQICLFTLFVQMDLQGRPADRSSKQSFQDSNSHWKRINLFWSFAQFSKLFWFWLIRFAANHSHAILHELQSK